MVLASALTVARIFGKDARVVFKEWFDL